MRPKAWESQSEGSSNTTTALLKALRRNIDIMTAAKCAKGYHFIKLPAKMFK